MKFIDDTGKISFVNQMDNFTQKSPGTESASSVPGDGVQTKKPAFHQEQTVASKVNNSEIKDNQGYQIETSVTTELKTASIVTTLSKKSDTEIVLPMESKHSASDRQASIDDMFATTTDEDILAQFIKDSKHSGGKGFKDKKKAFLSKTDLLFGLAKSEKNEAAASDVDDKVITILTYKARKHEDKAAYLKSELSAAKKTAKGSSGNSENVTQKKQSPFMESGYEFTDKGRHFTSPFADRFRLLGKDALGNDLFLPNGKEASQVTALIVQKKFGGSDKEEVDIKTDLEKDSKFGITTIREDENKSSKSVNSYFSKDTDSKKTSDSQQKFTTNEERYNKANDQRKTTKKEHSKETKKAARITAVSNFLRAKKITQNQLGNMSGEVTGDLVKDGAGFLQVITQSLMEAFKTKIKAAIISALASFLGFLGSIISAIAPFIIIVITVIIITTSFFSIFTDGVDVPPGDGYTYASLSDEEIDEIIENLYLLYPDLSYEQEVLLEYSLSKVGCEYNQNYHWSLTEDIFDCSSLAYRSYLEVGIDISNQGIYSAAEECRMVVDGMHLVSDELMPGDLIFYGGSDNDRYMGVYHVAIYVGDGKMVEARGTSWGVVYCDVRTTNAVAYGRYI